MESVEQELYRLLAWLRKRLVTAVAEFARSVSKFVLVGDSLIRQLAKSIACSLEFKLGMKAKNVVVNILISRNDFKRGFAQFYLSFGNNVVIGRATSIS